MNETKVDIGWVVGTSVVGLITAVCLGTIIIGALYHRAKSGGSFYYGGGLLSAGIGALVLILTATMFTWGMWPPFNMEYHSYRHVGGTVADVQARFLGADGGGSSQPYAIRLKGADQVYRCDDTRCSLIKPGDELWLWCEREWQQASTPGYHCNFDRSGRPS